MHLKHVGNAILFVVALQHFELKRMWLRFPPEIVVFTGGVFWHRHFFGTAIFLRSVTLVIFVGMRPTHNGNATVCDEI